MVCKSDPVSLKKCAENIELFKTDGWKRLLYFINIKIKQTVYWNKLYSIVWIIVHVLSFVSYPQILLGVNVIWQNNGNELWRKINK